MMATDDEPKYEFQQDPHTKLVIAILRGFWDLATVADFERDRRIAIQKFSALSDKPGKMRYLVDRSEQPPQSQDVVQALTELFAASKFQGRKAVVCSSMLQKLQIERINNGGRTEVFASRAEAIEWLDSAEADNE